MLMLNENALYFRKQRIKIPLKIPLVKTGKYENLVL